MQAILPKPGQKWVYYNSISTQDFVVYRLLRYDGYRSYSVKLAGPWSMPNKWNLPITDVAMYVKRGVIVPCHF